MCCADQRCIHAFTFHCVDKKLSKLNVYSVHRCNETPQWSLETTWRLFTLIKVTSAERVEPRVFFPTSVYLNLHEVLLLSSAVLLSDHSPLAISGPWIIKGVITLTVCFCNVKSLHLQLPTVTGQGKPMPNLPNVAPQLSVVNKNMLFIYLFIQLPLKWFFFSLWMFIFRLFFYFFISFAFKYLSMTFFMVNIHKKYTLGVCYLLIKSLFLKISENIKCSQNEWRY